MACPPQAPQIAAWNSRGPSFERARFAAALHPRAPLRVVHEPLAGVEGLFAGREREFLGAVATGQRTVLVHPLHTLHGTGRRNLGSRGARGVIGSGAGRAKSGCALGSARARGPGTLSSARYARRQALSALSARAAEPKSPRYVGAPCRCPNEPSCSPSSSSPSRRACSRRCVALTEPLDAPASAPPSSAPTPTAVAGIEHATGSTDVLLRYENGGGFVAPGFSATADPDLHALRRRDRRLPQPDARQPRPSGSVFPHEPAAHREAERGPDPGPARVRAR